MKIKISILCLFLLGALMGQAQISVTWPFHDGGAGQSATYDNTLFSSTLVRVKGHTYAGTKSVGGVTFSKLQPVEEVSSAIEAASIKFVMIPAPGITFTPTNVTFSAIRCGTGGSNIDYGISAGYSDEKILESGVKPNRDNEASASTYTSDVSGIVATADAPLQLTIYIYNLSSAKQVGLADISITGQATGEAGEIVYCNLSITSNIDGAATITQDPVGDSFVANTPVSVTVKASDGYRFVVWQDAEGNELSTLRTYDFVLNTDKNIVAVCRQLPVMDRGCYDFIVPDDGTVSEAIEIANERTDVSTRYRIFMRRGDHQMPASKIVTSLGSDGVEYPSPNNYVRTSNISFIGEDWKTTSFRNTLPQVYIDSNWGPQNPLEGNNPDALTIMGGVTGTYFQGVTLKSDMKDKTGRNAALKDYGNKTVFKDACLWGYQDTYVSNNNNNGRFYFEGGCLRGCTDFLCGKGDVFYNGVELLMCGRGILTAPSNPSKYGYVFKNCHITGPESSEGYALGRPWGQGTPVAVYIDTKMDIIPSTLGWNEMGDGYPARFAEYNSYKRDGSEVSLSGRKTHSHLLTATIRYLQPMRLRFIPSRM